MTESKWSDCTSQERASAPVTLDRLRARNPDNKWFFPIRMENKTSIKWKANIVECFGSFRKPIDELSWAQLLRRGQIAAETPEEQKKLEQWWTIGWQEMPQLPLIKGLSNPVMRIRETMNGRNLDLVYPSLRSAERGEGMCKEHIEVLSLGVWTKITSDYQFALMRTHNRSKFMLRQENQLPWILFAPDNTILGEFRTKEELIAASGFTEYKVLDTQNNNWNELPNGKWFWNTKWDLMPITPHDEPLGKNWRERCRKTQ